MSYIEKRNQVDLLQQKINSHGELSAEVKKKINYKFRLDWNYYSNSMEGNTLTKEETRSVMVGNLTVGGKPIKDVLEVKGHDDVITEILRIGKGEARLSEARIRSIHKGIMHEEDETKRHKIGEWKTEPNYIYNYKGERFDFALPDEVAEWMHSLLNKTNAAIDAIVANKKDAPHPLDVALQFHLDYVIIHPFYDGNGRTARILTNLLLISFGYPPFWVKDNERGIYNQYIGDIQGYGGSPDLFFEYAADMILRSQNLVLDAIEGKDISEPDDFEKELQQIELKLKNEQAKVIKKSHELVVSLFENSIKPLTQAMYEKLIKFNTFFTQFELSVFNGSSGQSGNKEMHDQLLQKAIADVNCRDINITYRWKGFNRVGNEHFDVTSDLRIEFDDFDYRINRDRSGNEKKLNYKKLYSQQLTQQEITRLVDDIANTILTNIKEQYKRITGKEL